jgi:virulence factor Mce-like protein
MSPLRLRARRGDGIAAGPLTQHTRWRIGTKVYGIVFLTVVAILLGLAIASFQKRFTPVAMVTLETSRLGSQLQEAADVKLRGLVVGEVRSIEVTPTGTRLHLAIQPDQLGQIPANVNARLLQKTLFGERFVDLVTVAAPSGRTLRAGDVITQDRSAVAIELETVTENLYPLLRTVQPAKLATTLGALATTLDGRGERLGQNLVLVDRYFSALNPVLPTLQRDISLLATTTESYAALTPDLVRLTEALRVTNRTVVDKDQQLASFLVETAGFANTTAGFLRDNEQRIIQVGRVQRPTLQVLAKYAPVYACMAQGLANWIPRISQAFSGGTFHITLEVVQPREPYRVGEGPRWGEKRGPHCYGLPSPRNSQANPFAGNHFDDGTRPAAYAHSALPTAFLTNASGGTDSGLAGTAEEQLVVDSLLAPTPDEGARPSAIQTLLAGPMMRGAVVSTR